MARLLWHADGHDLDGDPGSVDLPLRGRYMSQAQTLLESDWLDADRDTAREQGRVEINAKVDAAIIAGRSRVKAEAQAEVQAALTHLAHTYGTATLNEFVAALDPATVAVHNNRIWREGCSAALAAVAAGTSLSQSPYGPEPKEHQW